VLRWFSPTQHSLFKPIIQRKMKITKKNILSLLLISILLLSCSNDADKIKGRWSLTKRISPQGNIVDENSPFNVYENYTMDFNSDGKTLLTEYDSKGFGRGRPKHKEKQGEWKIEKKQ
jgi:hypothetical protein